MQNKRAYKNLISCAIKTVENFREKTKIKAKTKINEIMNNEVKNVQLEKNEIKKDKKEHDKTLFEVLFAIVESINFKIKFFRSQDQRKSKD